jgi:Na+-transporting NADH:ubiquinone oxidoreductase subunit C
MQGSVLYNLGFAAIICIVCAIFVSSAAVTLRDRQLVNQTLDMQRNVLVAAGLADDDEALTAEEIAARFEPVRQVVIDTATGDERPDIEPRGFSQRAMDTAAATSDAAPGNNAGIPRIGRESLVYELRDADGDLEVVVLPVRGLGLWGMLYGFLSLDADLETIHGLTFYEHKETPGLGGEVDNPRWKALWDGRKAFDATGTPEIQVIKGIAGSVDEAPHDVDGLAGATMTSRGVTNLLRFWLGEAGLGSYLDRLREERRD